MTESLLKTVDLSKSFGGIEATRNINLEVRPLETHAIIGPNGAGKTTLVSQLSGTLLPDRGAIYFAGQEITRLSPHRRAALGLARSFQITSLLMSMTVLDNVALAIQAHDGHSFRFFARARTEPGLRRRAQEVLARFDLAQRAHAKVATLSHGERRQVEIAVAVATGARLLLLDEPMAGMGREESRRIVALLEGLKASKTMLLIEHDMDVVFALADRISVLVDGALIATGTPEEIRANGTVRRAYLGEM